MNLRGERDADSAAMLQAGQYINRMDVSGCRFESMHGEAFSAPVRVEVTAHRGFISLCLIVEPETDLRFCILTARVRVPVSRAVVRRGGRLRNRALFGW